MTDGARERTTLSVDDALDLAVRLQRGDQVEAAATLFERILQVEPERVDALHFFGILKHQTGHSPEGIALLERAIRLAPEAAGIQNNLGNVLMQHSRWADAAAAYRAALAIEPSFVEAIGNLGSALRRLGEHGEAERRFRDAIALDPTHREAHENLGCLLSSRGRADEAVACLGRALELDPHNSETRRHLASTYANHGQPDHAIAILDAWLVDQPASAVAIHMRAAISGEDVPSRAPDAYVETTFDRMASTFDANLARLGYRAPALVGQALAGAVGAPGGALAILDAGCGTGLCGSLLRPFARELHGVDLSIRMLDRAAGRGVYDGFARAELTAFMRARPGAYDAIVSADTLCYFGSLLDVVAAAATALRPGGVLIFTVEASNGAEPFRLDPSGRYGHQDDHVRDALVGAGLSLVEVGGAVLRMERGEPVDGWVAVGRKPDGDLVMKS